MGSVLELEIGLAMISQCGQRILQKVNATCACLLPANLSFDRLELDDLKFVKTVAKNYMEEP